MIIIIIIIKHLLLRSPIYKVIRRPSFDSYLSWLNLSTLRRPFARKTNTRKKKRQQISSLDFFNNFLFFSLLPLPKKYIYVYHRETWRRGKRVEIFGNCVLEKLGLSACRTYDRPIRVENGRRNLIAKYTKYEGTSLGKEVSVATKIQRERI